MNEPQTDTIWPLNKILVDTYSLWPMIKILSLCSLYEIIFNNKWLPFEPLDPPQGHCGSMNHSLKTSRTLEKKTDNLI